MSTITTVTVPVETRLPESAPWSEAGFLPAAAAAWRAAGWPDAEAAATWMAASPDDQPAHLRRLHDAGYTADQVLHTARVTRRHVAAWTTALLRPAAPVDADTVIDLR